MHVSVQGSEETQEGASENIETSYPHDARNMVKIVVM
jgi:hypothetical protein